MRAILIDPFACTVGDLTLPDPTPGWESAARFLQAVYAALSHETFKVDSLDGVRLGRDDFLIVSGHGLLQDPPVQRWFRIDGLHFETLAGKGVIVGCDDESTESDTNFQVGDIDYRTFFFELTGGVRYRTNRPWRSRQ